MFLKVAFEKYVCMFANDSRKYVTVYMFGSLANGDRGDPQKLDLSGQIKNKKNFWNKLCNNWER